MHDEHDVAELYGEEVVRSYTSVALDQIHGNRVPYAAILDIPPRKGNIMTILPPDILQRILSFLLEQGYTIDITLRDRKPGRMAAFKSWFPGFDERPLFKVDDDLTDQCIAFLFSNNKFSSRNATSFQDLPRAMGEEWVSKIRNVELKNHFLYVTEPHRWATQLEFIVKKMPELTQFVLTNDFNIGSAPHASTGGDSRIAQERRALVSISAWLVLRHPVLKVLVWPANSGFDQNGRTWMSVKMVAKDNRIGSGDRIINSKKIRHSNWNDLHDISVEDMILPADPATSEGPDTNIFLEEDCALIDRYGYVTLAGQRKLGHNGRPYSLPKMIHQAHINKKQRAREERDAEARKRRDEMDVEQLAALTLARRGNNHSVRGKCNRGKNGGARGGKGGQIAGQATQVVVNNQGLTAYQAQQRAVEGGVFAGGSLFGGVSGTSANLYAPVGSGVSYVNSNNAQSSDQNGLTTPPAAQFHAQPPVHTSAQPDESGNRGCCRGLGRARRNGGGGTARAGLVDFGNRGDIGASSRDNNASQSGSNGSTVTGPFNTDDTDWPALGSVAPPRRR